MLEPLWILDAALELERGDRADARHARQPLADRVGRGARFHGAGRAPDLFLQSGQRLDQGREDGPQLRLLSEQRFQPLGALARRGDLAQPKAEQLQQPAKLAQHG